MLNVVRYIGYMVRSTRIGVPFGSLSWLQRQPELGVLVLRRWRGKAELEVGDNSRRCHVLGWVRVIGKMGRIVIVISLRMGLSSGRRPL